MSDSDFGTDLACVSDISSAFATVSGQRVVAEALLRRLRTPKGSLFYAPNYGIDVRDFLLARVDLSTLFSWKSAIEQECLGDERIEAATAELTYDQRTGDLLIELEVVTAEGPFTLTLTVDKVSATVLLVSTAGL